jgi:N-acetylglucosaminyl-diphospho-decaprenol L-rhamnosyltransferase
VSDGRGRPGAEPPWSAVVVTYEAGAHLTAAVASLLADHSAGGPPEVVVVDNGSADGSTEALRRRYPDVPVVVPGSNLGYARGANLGIACTAAPVVAVCNADVVVMTGAGAAMLARFAAEDDLGALGPSIRNPDGSPYPSARRDPGPGDALGHAVLGALWPDNPFTRRYRNLDLAPDLPRDADWCSGAAVWLRRAALDEVGGWDERYFLFFEDVDLGRRLRRAGWRVAYEPSARVTHALGASRNRRPVRSVLAHHRGAFRYAATWWRGPRRALLPAAAVALAGRGAVEAAVALARSRSAGRSGLA